MNPMARLAVPLVLGSAAAVVNWMVVESRTAASSFVRARHEIKVGELIDAASMGRMDLPGDPGSLKTSLVPYADRDVIAGTIARRDIFPGDLILWQDATRPDDTIPAEADERILPIDLGGVAVETSLLVPGEMIDFWVAPERDLDPGAENAGANGDQSRFKLIGPFRILSVGRRFARAGQREAERREGGDSDERIVSVAVKIQTDGNYDQDSNHLLEAHARRKIMAVALRPKNPGVNHALASSRAISERDE